MEEGNTVKGGGRRRRIVIVLAASILLGIGVVAFWPGEREPEYNGKKLSKWLGIYRQNSVAGKTAEMDEAGKAIKRIGTNGLPWLIKWVSAETPEWKHEVARIVSKGPTAVHWFAQSLLRADIRAENAMYGFDIMGEDASAAAPALTLLMNDPIRHVVSDHAIVALIKIGTNGLVAVFTTIRSKVCNPIVRGDVAYYLGYLKVNSGETVPTLIGFVADRNTPIPLRYASTTALGAIGEPAREAVPTLVRALKDDDEVVRMWAKTSLQAIAPEVMTNGVKDF